jgi:hypothetical protein
MIALRDKSWRRFGATLAGLALYLQLAFAGWGMLALATPGDAADALGGHALCLAGDRDAAQPTAPADSGPVAPVHDHGAFCCLWHPLPGLTPQAALTPRPIAYAAIGHDERAASTFHPGPHRGSAKARAPPIPA